MSAITTWGEITDEWIGRKVLVRWEDGTEPLFDGGPSGMPHERRGVVQHEEWYNGRECEPIGYELYEADIDGHTSGFPEHAHVVELP